MPGHSLCRPSPSSYVPGYAVLTSANDTCFIPGSNIDEETLDAYYQALTGNVYAMRVHACDCVTLSCKLSTVPLYLKDYLRPFIFVAVAAGGVEGQATNMYSVPLTTSGPAGLLSHGNLSDTHEHEGFSYVSISL